MRVHPSTHPASRLLLAAALTATVQACAHAPRLATAAPLAPADTVHTSASDPASDPDQAEALVRRKFTAEGVSVSQIELYRTDRPGVYSYTCYYHRDLDGQRCLYTARGQVAIATGKLSTRRELDFCLGPRPEAP